MQRLEDNQLYVVQYFERVRMEYHPENSHPYDVLLVARDGSASVGAHGPDASRAA